MAQTMTPSIQNQADMTDGQIDKAVDIFRAALRKHRSELKSGVAQQALSVDGLGMELLAVFRKRVEAVSDVIVRRVPVNRTRTPQDMLGSTSRKQYVDNAVVKAMPKGEVDEVDVFFFKLGHYVSDAELDQEYALRGLKAADPYSQGAVNEADPAFADDHPNGTHWKDGADKWCFAAFYRWLDERIVYVRRDGSGWAGGWWFAGLRK